MCKGDYVDTCTTQCSQSGGALFCDGSYIDVGDNLNDCVTAVNGIVTTKVTVSLSVVATASCTDGTCKASETTTTSCAASSAPVPRTPFAAFGGLLAILGLGARRRSRR
jgi:MYXO-CTERM domain-containing protein